MGISFAKLGDERCEICEEHLVHMKDYEKESSDYTLVQTDDQFDDLLKKNFQKKKEDIQGRLQRKDKSCSDDACTKCMFYRDHVEKERQSRIAYEADKRQQVQNNHENDKTTLFVSCDMQKVILLPRLPGYKLSLFTKRLVKTYQT